MKTWNGTEAAVEALEKRLWPDLAPHQRTEVIGEIARQGRRFRAWLEAEALDLLEAEDVEAAVTDFLRACAAASEAGPRRVPAAAEFRLKQGRGSLQQLLAYREAIEQAVVIRAAVLGRGDALPVSAAGAWLEAECSHPPTPAAAADSLWVWLPGEDFPHLVDGRAREIGRRCQTPVSGSAASLDELCGSLHAAVVFVLTGHWLRPSVTVDIHEGPLGIREITLRVLELEVTPDELRAVHRGVLRTIASEGGRTLGRSRGRDVTAGAVALALVALEVRHVEQVPRGAGFAAQVLRRWQERAPALGFDPGTYRTVPQVQKALDRMRKRAGASVFD